mmetsp:Transcript_85356/g.198464  ORF Transcript_85356/g.198464 Transcript_85356/m.198464 type:complete len:216 (+) Transcript_85356:58-705(+)
MVLKGRENDAVPVAAHVTAGLHESESSSKATELVRLGERLWMEESRTKALQHYAAALALAKAAGDVVTAAQLSIGVGFALMEVRRPSEALQHFRYVQDSGHPNSQQRAMAQCLIEAAELAVSEASAKQVATPREVDIAPGDEGASAMCAVCIQSAAELGSSLRWVFPGCGHKCLCDGCLKKMKKARKGGELECPLCRTRSKPLPSSQHRGPVYCC